MCLVSVEKGWTDSSITIVGVGTPTDNLIGLRMS